MSFKHLEDLVLDVTQDVAGDTYSYTQGATTTQIKGVFDNSYIDAEGVASLIPTLRIKLSDLPASPSKGDTVVISSITYRVSRSEPDSFGGSTLILQKV